MFFISSQHFEWFKNIFVRKNKTQFFFYGFLFDGNFFVTLFIILDEPKIPLLKTTQFESIMF